MKKARFTETQIIGISLFAARELYRSAQVLYHSVPERCH